MSSYSWIEGKDIVADLLTKQGSRGEVIEEIMSEIRFINAFDE